MYMYHLLGSIILKTIDPYYRRHLTSESLKPADYMYLETFIYTFVLIIFVIFRYFYNKNETIETYKNLKNVEIKDVVFLFIISFFFVYSTLMVYENEHKESAFINSVLLRGGTLVGILVVGILFYKEKYTWKQILGIIFSLLGIYLLLYK
jgi:drug/metabolite transporter (DMT)-like permease